MTATIFPFSSEGLETRTSARLPESVRRLGSLPNRRFPPGLPSIFFVAEERRQLLRVRGLSAGPEWNSDFCKVLLRLPDLGEECVFLGVFLQRSFCSVHIDREIIRRRIVQNNTMLLGENLQRLAVFIDAIGKRLDQRCVGRNFDGLLLMLPEILPADCLAFLLLLSPEGRLPSASLRSGRAGEVLSGFRASLLVVERGSCSLQSPSLPTSL